MAMVDHLPFQANAMKKQAKNSQKTTHGTSIPHNFQKKSKIAIYRFNQNKPSGV